MITIVAKQMVLMFIIILVGFVIKKADLADEAGTKTLSNILLMVVIPFVIVNSMLTVTHDAALLRGFFQTLILGFVTYGIGIAAVHFIFPERDRDAVLERYCAVYGNVGFMGIPLAQAMLGAEGVFYITAFIIVFNFLTWTHGVMMISGDVSLRHLLKGLCSPTIIAIAIGFVLYFLNVQLPSPAQGALEYVASMNTPLGMIVAGIALADAHPVAALKRRHVYVVSAVKLFAMPLAAVLIMLPLHLPRAVFYTAVVASASPAATTCTMLAMRYDRDYHYASELYVITTLLSMVSIPAVTAVAELFL